MHRAAAPPAETAQRLRTAIGRLVRRLRAEGELALPQATVLGRLDREGAQTTSALAAAERVRPQSMAQTVADLERAGLVGRRPDPADRRQILLELTAEGRGALERERRSREGWLERAIATELDAEERAVLRRAVDLLERLT